MTTKFDPNEVQALLDNESYIILQRMSKDIAKSYIQLSKEHEAQAAQIEQLKQERNNAAKNVRNELLPQLAAQDKQIEQLKAQVNELKDALTWSGDLEVPCQFDHHGYCQEHSCFEGNNACYVKDTIRLIEQTPEQSLQAHDDALRNATIDECAAICEISTGEFDSEDYYQMGIADTSESNATEIRKLKSSNKG
jgi:predicted RNase H-like nuclease (RuvC/YqgF family)